MSKPIITDAAAKKLALLRGDFLALTTDEAQRFIEELRDKRVRPESISKPRAVKVKVPKESKPPKVAKPPKDPDAPKPPRKPRVKKEPTNASSKKDQIAALQQLIAEEEGITAQDSIWPGHSSSSADDRGSDSPVNAPDGDSRHIESHTAPANGGAGKKPRPWWRG